MIVYGGTGSVPALGSGASYDIDDDRWNPIDVTSIPELTSHTAIWTGTTKVIYGGYDGSNQLDDVNVYDASANNWKTYPGLGAVGLLLCGGYDGALAYKDCSSYTPTTNSWNDLNSPLQSGLHSISAVLTMLPPEK